ncbi:MAG: tetratricopeptide repeat protein [Caldilineaceae bacterium]|nr:tetratricopeptide repeat protein [Caldilineaceae bacterium]
MNTSELPTHFGDLLYHFAQRELRSAGQLAEITELPLKTIQSWLEGRVKRPRDWKGILSIAAALNLTRQEVGLLLKAANHRGIEEIESLVRASQEKQMLDLIVRWERGTDEPSANDHPVSVGAVFQAVPAPAQIHGRDTEFAQLKKALLSGESVCILQGMPGVGKTVLAAKAAYELREHFPDGVLWAQVDKSDTMSILYSFAQAFGRDVSELQDVETRSAVLREVLAKKKALIVLDSTYQTDEIHLLRPPTTSPSVVLITTTNRRILSTEAVTIEVQPFGAHELADGLAFFMKSAAEVYIDEDRNALEKIIALVGGLPLALRIVASDLAQSTYMRPSEYYEYLADERTRLENLSDWNETSKDVRATLEMSYSRLPTTLKTLFCSLAVFKKAEFSVEAAAAVAEVPIPRMKRALAQLEALSLIEPYVVRDHTLAQIDTDESAGYLERYRLHTLLFIFATEKLVALQLNYQSRALHYYAHFVQKNHLFPLRISLEWENIVDIVNWGAQHEATEEFVLILEALTIPNVGVVGFLDGRGYWQQAYGWLDQALEIAETDPPLYARMHFKRGLFALRLAATEEAERHLQQSLQLLGRLAESEEQALYRAYVCEALAQLWMARERQQALVWSERGIAALRHLQSPAGQHQRGYLLIRHGTVLAQRGDLATGQQLIEEAFALLPVEPTAARISGLLSLGNIFDIQGNTERAHQCWQEGVKAAQALADHRRLAGLWLNLAIQAEELGQFAQCEKYNERALQIYRQIGDVDGEGRVLSNLAFNYLRQDNAQAALPYIEAADQIVQVHQLEDLAIHVQINYARWHLLQGELSQAESYLAQANQISERIDESETRSEILRLQARIMLNQGDFSRANELIDEALVAADTLDVEAGLCWGLKGEVLRQMGRLNEADVAFQRSIGLLARHPFDLNQIQSIRTLMISS